MATVTVKETGIEGASKISSLQAISNNCSAQQLQVLQKMVLNPKLNEIIKQSTMDKLEKNLPMLKAFL